MAQSRDITAALTTFRRHGGVLRTSQALALGIHPHALYQLRDDGQVTQLARGLYRLAAVQEFRYPDLAIVAAKAPDAVICLISALAFHEITTQIPRAVSIAVPQGRYHRMRLRSPPVQVFRFNPTTFAEGIEVHKVDGISLRVYSVARTLVDCFKYRNKLGLDVAVEALRFARARKHTSNRDILKFVTKLRQDRIMGPYLEATA